MPKPATAIPRPARRWSTSPTARFSVNLQWRGSHLRVEVTAGSATYTCVDGKPITFTHHGEEIEVTEGSAVTRSIPPLEERPNPGQPAGRAPEHREPRGAAEGAGR
jgi:alpha,alpha-trehalose phosphorylase